MSMIERCEVAARRAVEDATGGKLVGGDYVIARAVIEALMEPTPEVLRSGGQEYAMTHQRGNTAEAHAHSIMKAMLRAALNEGEGE
jgi:hypothetical protein